MELCMCCASLTMVPIPARTPSVSKSSERRSTPALDGMSPPSNQIAFRRDTTITARRPGSRQLHGSRLQEGVGPVSDPVRSRMAHVKRAQRLVRSALHLDIHLVFSGPGKAQALVQSQGRIGF